MSPKAARLMRLRDEGDFSPFPVAVRAGDFIYAPCVMNAAVGDPRPLDAWPSRHESKIALLRLRSVIERAGGSMDDLINLLQCFEGRGQTAGYVQERVSHFAKGVPTSTGSATTALATPGALIQLDAVGVVPSQGKELEYIGGISKNASYSNAIAYGGVVYFSGVMTGAPETQPDPKLWFGSAVKNELKFIVQEKLAPIAREAGCDVADIAVAHFHLLNPTADFGPFREMVDELFPAKKPVFMVSASSGLGALPGRVELTPIAVRPNRGVAVADIQPKGLPLGMMDGPQAKRVGDFVYISTQFAGDRFGRIVGARVDPRGRYFFDQTAAEMSFIVERLKTICAEAGGGAANLVRLRLYVHDMKVAAPAIAVIRREIGDDVPVSLVEDAGAAGWLGECSISADAVAYIPLA
ncbi:MAG: RidA family protein [Roseiarcus sp.]